VVAAVVVVVVVAVIAVIEVDEAAGVVAKRKAVTVRRRTSLI